jgi:hypothetical protein
MMPAWGFRGHATLGFLGSFPLFATRDKGCYPEYDGSTLSKFGLFDL